MHNCTPLQDRRMSGSTDRESSRGTAGNHIHIET
jgi:hypothetical protein